MLVMGSLSDILGKTLYDFSSQALRQATPKFDAAIMSNISEFVGAENSVRVGPGSSGCSVGFPSMGDLLGFFRP